MRPAGMHQALAAMGPLAYNDRMTYTPPKPEDVKHARELATHSQAQAAALVHVDMRTWRRWELGERAMPGAAWELYRIKTIGLTPIK